MNNPLIIQTAGRTEGFQPLGASLCCSTQLLGGSSHYLENLYLSLLMQPLLETMWWFIGYGILLLWTSIEFFPSLKDIFASWEIFRLFVDCYVDTSIMERPSWWSISIWRFSLNEDVPLLGTFLWFCAHFWRTFLHLKDILVQLG